MRSRLETRELWRPGMASFALSVSRLQARTQPARDLREGREALENPVLTVFSSPVFC